MRNGATSNPLLLGPMGSFLKPFVCRGAPQTTHALSSNGHSAAFGYRSCARRSNIAASASHNVWVARACRSRKKNRLPARITFWTEKANNRRSKCRNEKQRERPRRKRKSRKSESRPLHIQSGKKPGVRSAKHPFWPRATFWWMGQLLALVSFRNLTRVTIISHLAPS